MWVQGILFCGFISQSDRKRKSEKEIEQKRKSESENEKKERESVERKGKTKVSFYAKESEDKRASSQIAL